MIIAPITPQEIQTKKAETIPSFVIKAVNDCIVTHWTGSRSSFTQDELIAEIQKHNAISREEIFRNNYLDFEPNFRQVGWKVRYDKPAYCESYSAFFVFTL